MVVVPVVLLLVLLLEPSLLFCLAFDDGGVFILFLDDVDEGAEGGGPEDDGDKEDGEIFLFLPFPYVCSKK